MDKIQNYYYLFGKRYRLLLLEVSGQLAMYKRYDTGSHPVSEVIPHGSAITGMYDNIYMNKNVFLIPFECAICCDINFYTTTYNTHSSFAKSDCVKKGAATQITENILFNTCHQLKVMVVPRRKDPNIDLVAAYIAKFVRARDRGKFYRPVCLGEQKYLASYAGRYRPDTLINSSINKHIPHVTMSMFDKLVDGITVNPLTKSVDIKNGVAKYFASDEELAQFINDYCEMEQ